MQFFTPHETTSKSKFLFPDVGTASTVCRAEISVGMERVPEYF
jgi:hypothetical protein